MNHFRFFLFSAFSSFGFIFTIILFYAKYTTKKNCHNYNTISYYQSTMISFLSSSHILFHIKYIQYMNHILFHSIPLFIITKAHSSLQQLTNSISSSLSKSPTMLNPFQLSFPITIHYSTHKQSPISLIYRLAIKLAARKTVRTE